MLQSNKRILFRNVNYFKKLWKRSISGSKIALNRDIMFFNLRPKFDGFVPIKEVLKFKKKSDLTFTSSHLYPTVRNSTKSNEDETKEFMAVFPDILRELSDTVNDQNKTEISSWYRKVLEYNLPTGKKNRGLSLVSTYKMLEKPTNLTNENVKLAIILGWCTEMLQAHFLVLDDIMDGSQTRRGKDCWYKIENIGFSAINDAMLIENGIYALLKRHFRSHMSYIPMFEIFKDVTMKTCIGQKLDLTKINGENPDFNLFTSDRYQLITQYKTAYYSFQLPVSLALLMCNIVDEQLHQQAKNILLEIGHFFQVQDDFLDCFGNPDVLGKIGSDIREGKCTWLAVEALKRSSETQKKVMYEHYGIKDDSSVEKIRNLYEDLDLPKAYAIYEDRTYTLIHNMIQRVINDLLPHEIFYKFIEKIYRREC